MGEITPFPAKSVAEPVSAPLEVSVAGILGGLGYLFPAIHTHATLAAEPDRYDRYGVKRDAALRHIESAETKLRELRELLAVAGPDGAA